MACLYSFTVLLVFSEDSCTTSAYLHTAHALIVILNLYLKMHYSVGIVRDLFRANK